MADPIGTVEAFLTKLGEPGGFGAAVRQWFTPATVYENVGLSKTTGVEQAMAVVEQFETGFGACAIRVDTLSICAAGNKVLTERIDHLVDASGKVLASIPLMGMFEVEEGKVTAWRDYFDTAPFRGEGGT